MQHVVRRPAQSIEAASLIELAPSEPPETSTHCPPGSPSASRAAPRSVNGGSIGRPVTTKRPRPARGAGNARQTTRANGASVRFAEAEVAVGLGEHQRDAPRERRAADDAGNVTAGAEHRVGRELAEQPARLDARADSRSRAHARLHVRSCG